MRASWGLAACLAACAAPAPPGPPADPPLAARFAWVAFRDDAGAPKPLMRWEEPLRVEVHGAGRWADEVAAQLDLLGTLTGLPVRQVATGGNLQIRFGSAADLAPVEAAIIRAAGLPPDTGFDCYGVRFDTPEGPLEIIGIRNHLDDALTRLCILQETTQALGMVGDLATPDTVFTDAPTGPAALTLDDRRIVRLFYRPELRPGMTEAEAMPIVRRLLAAGAV